MWNERNKQAEMKLWQTVIIRHEISIESGFLFRNTAPGVRQYADRLYYEEKVDYGALSPATFSSSCFSLLQFLRPDNVVTLNNHNEHSIDM